MYIKKLTLKGYIRMSLNTFDKITYTPRSLTQIILGTNGHGKSSLLEQLSPLPANLKEFNSDGYKECEILHNGKVYMVGSYGSTNKHSFKVDNVELNHGGTKKVQLRLCEEHFKLTPNIFKVILGTKKFTNMSLAERKDWFTNISTLDYEYAIGVYNKAKRRQRDLIGVIKTMNAKLTEKKKSILPQDSVNDLKELVVLDRKLLVDLYSSAKVVDNVEVIDISIIEKMVTRLKDLEFHSSISSSDLSNSLTEYRTKLKMLEQQLKLLSHEIATLDDTSNTDARLNKELNSINSKIREIYDLNVHGSSISEIENFNKFLNSNYKLLRELLLEMSNFIELPTINRRANLSSLKTTLREHENRGLLLSKRIKDITEHLNAKDLKCPKCGTTCEAMHTIEDKETLEGDLEEIEDKIRKIKELIDNVKEEIRIEDSQNIILERVKEIFESAPSKLRDLLFKDIILKDATLLYNRLKDLNGLYKELSEITGYMGQRDKIMAQIDGIRKSNLEAISKRKNELMAEISKVENSIDGLKENIRLTEITIKEHDFYLHVKEEVKKANDNYNEVTMSGLNKIYNSLLSEHISILEESISASEEKLREYQFSIMNIKSIEDDINEFKDRLKVTTDIVDALSPTDGIIGRSVLGFLNNFMARMDKFINSIWTYQINVLPCTIDDESLTYKFPVTVRNMSPVPDVSDLSLSMKEVVDLAFKLVSMEFMGLKDYPLYLDEFASSFDPVHRLNAYDGIEKIRDKYSQTFIVSHYLEVFSRFTDADVTVISKDNMFMGEIKKYNEVASFE